MKTTVLARLATLLFVVALLLPAFSASASHPGNYGRRGRAGIHRPVYTIYKKYRASSQLLPWKR